MWRPSAPQPPPGSSSGGGPDDRRSGYGAPPHAPANGGGGGGYGPPRGGDSYGPPPPPGGGGGGGYGPPRGGFNDRGGPPPPSYDRDGPRGGGGGYDDRGRGGFEERGRPGPPGGFDDRGRGGPSLPPPMEMKRERDEPDGREDPDAPRKRRSRWGDSAPSGPGAPAIISNTNVSQKELDQYATRMRIEEINTKLRLNDIVPPDHQRSPSPPPTYDAHGRRTNTREVRYRRKLEDERVKLVDRALKLDPAYRPPSEYHSTKRQRQPQDKVYIPVKEFPEIKFFGLLVGPRGNTLKGMERDSGAKISIRGKGSVKSGKGRPDSFSDDAEDDLHCLVMGDTEEQVKHCVELINNVIATAASLPEAQNDHKRNQLRELAALNGTLRDDENQVCQNCGNLGHKKWDCPEQRNYAANIICHNCGSQGHMARDCRAPRGGGPQRGGPGAPPGGVFDAEYANLMSELGEGGGIQQGAAVGMIEGPGAGGPPDGARPPWAAGGAEGGGPPIPQEPKLAPWRDPNNWITPNQRMAMGGPPHFGGGGGFNGPMGGGPGGFNGHMGGGGGFNGPMGGGPGGFNGPGGFGPPGVGWGHQQQQQGGPGAGWGQQQQQPQQGGYPQQHAGASPWAGQTGQGQPGQQQSPAGALAGGGATPSAAAAADPAAAYAAYYAGLGAGGAAAPAGDAPGATQ